MPTDPGTIDFLLDQIGGHGASFTTKRMFGEYCVYRSGQPVAFVCDDVLFVKDTPPGRDAIATVAAPEFGPPYPCAKMYLRLAPDAWDDGNWLRRVLDATAAALPVAKPKAAKKTAKTQKPKAPARATRSTDGTAPTARNARRKGDAKAADKASKLPTPTTGKPKH